MKLGQAATDGAADTSATESQFALLRFLILAERIAWLISTENGLFVLDVSHDIDHQFVGYLNDIRVEAVYLEEIP